MHGCTGKASAEERVGPELARALGCSIHEINFTLVQEVAGTAVVLAVQYPWSSDRYDQVAKFLDIAQFKFKDPMNGRVSHLVITDTLAAMAMLARVPMRKQLEDPSSKGEDEDEIEVVDLKPLLQVTYPGKIDRKSGEDGDRRRGRQEPSEAQSRASAVCAGAWRADRVQARRQRAARRVHTRVQRGIQADALRRAERAGQGR